MSKISYVVTVPMTSLPGSASQGLKRLRLRAPLGTEQRDDGAGSDGHCSIGHVNRLTAWLAGFAGGAAVYRLFKRAPAHARTPVRREPDPADALKAKLAEARTAGDGRDEAEAGETTVDEAPDPDVESRRRAVHEQGRSAIDEMRSE
jgi:hypothetical protein